MKKTVLLLLVLMLFVLTPTMAATSQTATFTTEVPDATYTLTIPANATVQFGELYTDIGNLSVSNTANFSGTKSLWVTLNWEDFSSTETNNTIPFSLSAITSHSDSQYTDLERHSHIIFHGKTDGTLDPAVVIPSSEPSPYITISQMAIHVPDWGSALAGTYTGTVTFTSEVIIEQ